MSIPIQITPDKAIHEFTEINQKIVKGIEILSRLKEDDIQVGTAPKELVYKEDKLKLYRFTPVVEQPFRIPLLFSYALVNRWTVADLQEDRSLIRNLLKEGIDIYLIDWGDPSRMDRWLTLDDYVNGYLDNCVDFIREKHGLDQINLLGICQGGTISTCYSALHPEKIKNLVLTVTPIDFHADLQEENEEWGLLNVWARHLDIDPMIDALGIVPAELLNFSFMLVRPMSLNVKKYTDMIDIIDDEQKMMNFLRMEKWLNEGPDSAGETYRQFVKDFFQQNKLIKNEVQLGTQRVDLGNLSMPILNCYATQDHLVPPKSTRALGKYAGSKDYSELAIPAGHIGFYVSGKSQKMLAPGIAKWLKERD
jgi:polyhydroxyalkanoate synthase subunit PhaC